MKRIVLLGCFWAASVFAGQFFIESSNPEPRELLPDESATQEGVSFSSQAGYALITVAGFITMDQHEGMVPTDQTTTTWLEVDGDSIGVTGYSVPAYYVRGAADSDWMYYYGYMSYSYVTYLEEGGHLIELKIATPPSYGGSCTNTYLQVLVHTEEPAAVTEGPSADPLEVAAVLTSGPLIYAPDAESVFDATGREIECEIKGGYLNVSDFPSGTYTIVSHNGRTRLIKIK